MGLEVATFISQLVAANPTGSDDYATADDHLRLVKTVLQTQFPNFGAVAITPDAAEINKLDGLTASQAELNKLDGFTGLVADLEILSGAAAGGLTATELMFLNGVTSGIQAQIDAKAATAHNHNASDINAGTLAVARIPNLDTSKITTGIFAAAFIPSLDASKITTGTFGTARIPNLAASKITSGILAVARGGTGVGTSTGTGNNVLSASPTLTGTILAAALTLTSTLNMSTAALRNAHLDNYALFYQTPTVAASTTIDYQTGQAVTLDLQPASITTLTLSNPPATGRYGELNIEIIQGSTARTITWPASVKWPGGAAPTLTTTNDAVDIVHLWTRNAGTTWHGSFVLDSK